MGQGGRGTDGPSLAGGVESLERYVRLRIVVDDLGREPAEELDVPEGLRDAVEDLREAHTDLRKHGERVSVTRTP